MNSSTQYTRLDAIRTMSLESVFDSIEESDNSSNNTFSEQDYWTGTMSVEDVESGRIFGIRC